MTRACDLLHPPGQALIHLTLNFRFGAGQFGSRRPFCLQAIQKIDQDRRGVFLILFPDYRWCQAQMGVRAQCFKSTRPGG